MFHLISMLIVGIVVGFVARLLMPGHDPISIWMTGLLGIGGSFVGGFVARLFSKPAEGSVFHPAGFFMSVIGALILLFAWHHLG